VSTIQYILTNLHHAAHWYSINNFHVFITATAKAADKPGTRRQTFLLNHLMPFTILLLKLSNHWLNIFLQEDIKHR